MQVFAYTYDKETVVVDLSIELIVSAEIYPWSIDLFDPDPISMTVNEKPLYFRRVQNVCLAYKTANTQVLANIHNGSSWLSVSGKLRQRRNDCVPLYEIKVDPIDFKEFYHTYLSLLSQVPASDWPRLRWMKEQEQVLAPIPAQETLVQGDALLLMTSGPRFQHFAFTGEMFNEIKTHCNLPAQVNWVFEQFGKWHPVVEFKLQSLVGARLKEVVIFVDQPGLAELLQRFGGNSSVTFKDNRTSYTVYGKNFLKSLNLPDEPESVHKWYIDALSVDRAWSLSANELRCSRIGFFDLAKRQARVQRSGLHEDMLADLYQERLCELIMQHFTLIDGPWLEHPDRSKLPLLYRLLKGRVPGARLLYKANELSRSALGQIESFGQAAHDHIERVVPIALRAAYDWLTDPKRPWMRKKRR